MSSVHQPARDDAPDSEDVQYVTNHFSQHWMLILILTIGI